MSKWKEFTTSVVGERNWEQRKCPPRQEACICCRSPFNVSCHLPHLQGWYRFQESGFRLLQSIQQGMQN